MMQKEELAIDGLLLLRPRVFSDVRGSFMETWNERTFREQVGDHRFVQDNESISRKGVLRGLHFQLAPHAQGKLVRAVTGAVLHVCVDIRAESPTYGKYLKVLLTAADRTMLWIPPGFAHGFVALVEDTVFTYKCTAPYHPAAERTILWNDPDLAIDWGIARPIVSERDRNGFAFAGAWATPTS